MYKTKIQFKKRQIHFKMIDFIFVYPKNIKKDRKLNV